MDPKGGGWGCLGSPRAPNFPFWGPEALHVLGRSPGTGYTPSFGTLKFAMIYENFIAIFL